MFDEIFGLPAHPLIVHAPVVLVPLAALLALGYGLLPPLRRTLGWLLVLCSLAAAAGAIAAVQSGQKFEQRLGGGPPGVAKHSDYGTTVRNLALLLAVVAIVLVGLDLLRRRRARHANSVRSAGLTDSTGRAPKRSSGTVLLGAMSVVLTLALLVVAAGATWAVVRAGHTGAEMVWSEGG